MIAASDLDGVGSGSIVSFDYHGSHRMGVVDEISTHRFRSFGWLCLGGNIHGRENTDYKRFSFIQMTNFKVIQC